MAYMWNLVIKRDSTVTFNEAIRHLKNDTCLIEDTLDKVVQNLRKTITFYVHKELEVINPERNEYAECIMKYPVDLSIYGKSTFKVAEDTLNLFLNELNDNLVQGFRLEKVENFSRYE